LPDLSKYTTRVLIGKKIKHLRMQRNLTQQELADILGCERQYVWTLENGGANITLDYIDKLAAAFSIAPHQFLTITI